MSTALAHRIVFWGLFLLNLFGASNGFARSRGPSHQADPSTSATIDKDAIAIQYRIHGNSEYRTAVTNWGNFGSQNQRLIDSADTSTLSPRWAPGFEAPPFSRVDYLFEAGLWIGGVVAGDTLVSVGSLGFQLPHEFFPMSGAPPVLTDALGDEEYTVVYVDTITDPQYVAEDDIDGLHRPLPVEVRQVSRLVEDPQYANGLIVEVTIRNIGFEPINDLWAGWLIDCDIGHIDIEDEWVHDISGYRTSEVSVDGQSIPIRAGWSADIDGRPDSSGHYDDSSATRVFGSMYLGGEPSMPDESFNWWIIGFNSQFDWGPQMAPPDTNPRGGTGTPIGDAMKYRILSNREIDYEQVYAAVDRTSGGWIPPTTGDIAREYADGYDTRFLHSVGTMTLSPGDSVTMAWGWVIPDGWHTDPAHFDNSFDYEDPLPYLNGLNMTVLDTALARMQILWDSQFDSALIGPPKNWTLTDWDDHEAYLQWAQKGTERLQSFEIRRSTDSLHFDQPPIVTLPGTITNYTDIDLDRTTVYYYAIQSVGNDGAPGPRSPAVDVLPDRPKTPSAPIPTRGDKQISLAWTPSPEPDIVGQRVYRRPPFGEYELIGESDNPRIVDLTTQNATLYEYRVSSVSELGSESYPSDGAIGVAFAFDGPPLIMDHTLSGPTSQTDKVSVATVWNRLLDPTKVFYRDVDPSQALPLTVGLIGMAKAPAYPVENARSLALYDHHPVTIVVSDGRFSIRPDTEEFLTVYTLGSGIVILSGRDLFNYDALTEVSVTFGPGDFAYDALGITSTDYPRVLLSNPTRMNAEFVGARAAVPGLSDLSVDPGRTDWGLNPQLPPTNGAVPFVGTFEIDTSRAEALYTFVSNLNDSPLDGEIVGILSKDPRARAAAFSFPMSYMIEEQARDALNEILRRLGWESETALSVNATAMIEYLYHGGRFDTSQVGDLTGDGTVDLLDVVRVLQTSLRQGRRVP